MSKGVLVNLITTIQEQFSLKQSNTNALLCLDEQTIVRQLASVINHANDLKNEKCTTPRAISSEGIGDFGPSTETSKQVVEFNKTLIIEEALSLLNRENLETIGMKAINEISTLKSPRGVPRFKRSNSNAI